MPSRKRVIRTPILGGGFPLSLCPILGNPLGLPPFLLMQQPKIRSLKILRPEKDSILSRFWCGRCSKARRLAKMTSQKMPKFCLFRRVRIALFRLRCAGWGSLPLPSFCGRAFNALINRFTSSKGTVRNEKNSAKKLWIFLSHCGIVNTAEFWNF